MVMVMALVLAVMATVGVLMMLGRRKRSMRGKMRRNAVP